VLSLPRAEIPIHMASLVANLQRDIQNSKKSVTEVLRTAKLISAKLGLTDIEEWIGHELSGYPNGASIPEYRQASGVLQVHNPYRGWILVSGGSSLMGFDQSIFAIEDLARQETVAFQPQTNIPVSSMYSDMDSLAAQFPQRIVFTRTVFKAIAEAVRGRLLDWSIELEKRGIIGDDMSFDKEEKQKAQNQTFNIQHFTGVLGDVKGSNVSLYDYSSIHQVLKQQSVPQNERNEFENILDELKTSDSGKKASLLERGKAWIVRNQEFLGASVALVRKALGLGEAQ
jgi:hypothetical protein